MQNHNKSYFRLVLIIVLIAAFFRLYHLGSVPPGLYPDEAMNGNNAIQAWENKKFQVFYPENNGREGLFINLQAVSIALIGNEAIALRAVSALFGIFTILGLYFLTKTLFNREIALLSSFLMAISFWHITFSRIGFRAIMAPFFLVWMLYFFWLGLRSSKLFHFIISGILLGLGLYSYIAFRILPLALLITILIYWQFLKKDILPDGTPRYKHLKKRLEKGLLGFILAATIISLPLILYFVYNPADFIGRTAQVSVLNTDNPAFQFLINFFKTMGMFNFSGDFNWRHGMSGAPLLIWPVGIFFAVGFIRGWIKLFKLRKSHGHLSSIQMLLLSTFFVVLLPVISSNEGVPHALRALIAAPIVFIFAGEGIWWFFENMKLWYKSHDPLAVSQSNLYSRHENRMVSLIVLLFFLAAIATVEYNRYFNRWAKNPEVAGAFSQNYVDLGKKLNRIGPKVKKYVVVNAGGVLVRGIPMPAQTVMFITDTWTPEKQKARNIFYLTEEQFLKRQYDRRALIVKLNP